MSVISGLQGNRVWRGGTTMVDDERANSRSRVLRPLAQIGSRAASTTLRPITGAAAVAVEAGATLERRAVRRVLDSPEFERLFSATLDRPEVQAMIKQALGSVGARQLIASFFDSGLFDEFADRLLASKGLWRLVDDVAGSPAVNAAITQQSLGFADQVAGEVRTRSRKADDLLERLASRLVRRNRGVIAPSGDELRPESP
jgi:hypothetical protein